MNAPPDYELIDFGAGRRLERFGSLLLDRPAPAVENVRQENPKAWDQADAKFVPDEGSRGSWIEPAGLSQRWTVTFDRLVLELKRTEFGHLGVFPEQATNWEWIARRTAEASMLAREAGGGPLRVLNLFAYTGGSTLAAVIAGAEVTHVDAARNVVAWARRNAEFSGLGDRAIRWIDEDARKFVRREINRQARYDAVILDPPSFGHGPRNEIWRLSKHLPALVAQCAELTNGHPKFILLTCHTPGYGPSQLRSLLEKKVSGTVSAAPLTISTASGRRMPAGVVARLS